MNREGYIKSSEMHKSYYKLQNMGLDPSQCMAAIMATNQLKKEKDDLQKVIERLERREELPINKMKELLAKSERFNYK